MPDDKTATDQTPEDFPHGTQCLQFLDCHQSQLQYARLPDTLSDWQTPIGIDTLYRYRYRYRYTLLLPTSLAIA